MWTEGGRGLEQRRPVELAPELQCRMIPRPGGEGGGAGGLVVGGGPGGGQERGVAGGGPLVGREECVGGGDWVVVPAALGLRGGGGLGQD